MTVEKSKPKQLLRPITTGAGSAMNQSQFLAITCNSLEAREKSRVHDVIGFASHWLKNWRESFKPITKDSNCNHVITFDSHLKTALKNTSTTITMILPRQIKHNINKKVLKREVLICRGLLGVAENENKKRKEQFFERKLQIFGSLTCGWT